MTKPWSVTRILCPTDFSAASDAAIRAAEAIAQSFGARIDLVHVWLPPVAMAYDAAFIPTPDQIVGYTNDMQKNLAATAARISLPADRVDRHLIQGVPWQDVIATAVSKGCDLIVMSTHGRTGLTHFVMGSVAERVVRSSPVPVLVVPAPRP